MAPAGQPMLPRIADPHTYEQVIAAEIASEIVNRAQAIIYARIYDLEGHDPGAVAHLTERAAELYRLLRSIRVTDDERVAAITATWGALVKDETAFWSVIEGPGELPQPGA